MDLRLGVRDLSTDTRGCALGLCGPGLRCRASDMANEILVPASMDPSASVRVSTGIAVVGKAWP